MNPQFTLIDGLRIAYIEKNPDKEHALIFIHGNSCSSESWYKQFTDPILDGFRLIAIDLPGHGLSDDSQSPQKDYNLLRLGQISAAFVRDLQIESYVGIGFSLGANIIAEMLANQFFPKGIALLGSSVVGEHFPLSDIVIPRENVSPVFTDDASPESIEEHAGTNSTSVLPKDKEIFLRNYHNTRKPFRSSFFRSVTDQMYSDEIRLLKNTGLQVCVIMGAEEKVIKPDYLDNAPFELWRGEVHKIPGASHLVHIDQPLYANQLIYQYAGEMFGDAPLVGKKGG